jgi:UPF0755 protein
MVQKTVWFGYSRHKKQKSKKWVLFMFIAILIIAIRWWIKYSPSDLVFENQKVSIVKWDTISKFYDALLDDNQTFWMKLYVRNHKDQVPNIQEWTYVFSGTYTNEEFLSHIAKWPEKEYISYTILEWRSIYDIDADLTAKWYINEWEYVSYVTDPAKISELSTRYDFFDSSLTSLEWFLYPDTYFLDNWWNLVNQLVSIQLNTFKSKVREAHAWDFSNIQSKYWLSIYQTITLASIVEKEEKNNTNKPTVAGIFYNRLQNWMLLWADITLCYGFAKPYSECTPNVIAKNVGDSNNKYNTRAVAWLTPTPIWNPALPTIEAVLFPNQTSYLFYLHGADGQIHYAETNAQHEQNKQYL